jgi:hypothetical protein
MFLLHIFTAVVVMVIIVVMMPSGGVCHERTFSLDIFGIGCFFLLLQLLFAWLWSSTGYASTRKDLGLVALFQLGLKESKQIHIEHEIHLR